MKEKPFTPPKKITKAQFIKMNKSRRRVYLAKDVITQLRAERYQPMSIYFGLGSYDSFHSSENAKEVLNNKIHSCYVCAKGALACSYVANFNGYNYAQFISNTDQLDELRNIFGDDVWNRIEALFEGSSYGKDGMSYHHNMEAIMQNIIDNKGTLTL